MSARDIEEVGLARQRPGDEADADLRRAGGGEFAVESGKVAIAADQAQAAGAVNASHRHQPDWAVDPQQIAEERVEA